MTNSFKPSRAAIWVAALSASAAIAQSSVPSSSTVAAFAASASDPNASVPSVVYQSVFADSRKGVETQTIDWKKANAEVGQFRRGHVDILKWEEANPSANPSGKTPVAPASKGSGSGTDASATPHKH